MGLAGRRPACHLLSTPPRPAPHLVLQVWIAPGTGLGNDFVAAVDSLSPTSEVAMLLILVVFALIHSGLAFLRPAGGLPCLDCAPSLSVMLLLVTLPAQ